MRIDSRLKFGWLLLLVLIIGTQIGARAQSGSSLATIVARDARFAAFHALVVSAEMTELFDSNSTITLFIPSNHLLEQADSPATARQIVLTHTVFGHYDIQAVSGEQQLKNGFGKMIHVETTNGLRLNGQARIVGGNIPASNGLIHMIDATLMQAEGVAGSPTSASPTNPYKRPPEPLTYITNPHQNPAYVSGRPMAYRHGILSGLHHCKGMTWTVHEQDGRVTHIGSDRRTNPYRGDTPCNQSLPLVCIQRTEAVPPPAHWDGWAFGSVKATLPVRGTELRSREHADNICVQAYGHGWRMAEFHNGNRGSAIGWISGHDFWAYGNLPVGERLWVAIEDQAANPWNSQTPSDTIPSGNGLRTLNPGDDQAYIGNRPLRMSEAHGRQKGRHSCQGMTWVVHRQIANRVQVGADLSSNPFVGDRNCAEMHPILCIRVDGLQPPPSSDGFNYSHGWSGGIVALSRSVTGNQISQREQANKICQQSYGPAWRMAEFHDGLLGANGTDGWEFWAYGNLPTGYRFWVANNDQPANPWNH